MAEKVTEEQLVRSAERLIDQLPDQIGELVRVLQGEYQLPLWHLVCGILLEVHSEGRLSSFQIDPAWREGLRQKMLRCQYEPCGKLFKPKWLAQQFCSNACGLASQGKFPQSEAVKVVEPPKEVKRDDAYGKPTGRPVLSVRSVAPDISDPAHSADPIDVEDAIVAERAAEPVEHGDWGSTMVQPLDD